MHLDINSIHVWAQELRNALERIEHERATLNEEEKALIKALESVESLESLALTAIKSATSNNVIESFPATQNDLDKALSEASAATSSRVPVGKISVRRAVLEVIRAAKGESLHVSEIWRRAEALGAKTTGKDPRGVVDFVCYSLRRRNILPLEKTAPRTWRWTGAIGDSSAPSLFEEEGEDSDD